jgi:HEAT repeat protein
MSRVPSIQWFGVLCGIALVGCSNATPPQPKPEPPKAVAVAPVEPAKVEPAAKPAPQAVPVAAAPAATPETKQPAAGQVAAGQVAAGQVAAGATPADPLAALRQTLAAAPDKDARVLVIDDIAKLGQNAKGALADLIKATADEDPRTRWHAARAIGMIGEDALSAMPVLLGLLADTDPIVATQSAAAIGLIREDDGRKDIPAADALVYASAVDPLIKSTTHPDARVRRSAVRTLRRLAPSPEQLAPLLSKQLADVDPSVVMPALQTLADMDDDAVPFLLEALNQPKSRYWATIALAEIGPEAAPAVDSLARLAAEGETEERMQAFLALAAIGEKAATASPVMVQALESDNNAVHFPAAFALGSVRATDADAALEKAAAGNDPFLAEVASWARARIHPDDKALVDEAVKRLRTGLHSDRPNERAAATSGLSDLSEKLEEPVRRELAGEFADLLSDPVADVGIGGGGALIRLGATAVDTLRERLADPALRGRVLEILGAIGPAATPAVDDMIKSLDDADPDVRGDAAVALAAIGPDAAAAVPSLTKMLADEAAPAARFPAAYALGRIGPAAKPALEQLRALTTSPDEVMATVALWSTLKISPEDRSLFAQAIPALRKAVRAEREIVRLEAAVALGEIGAAAESAIPVLELVSEEDPSKPVRAAAAAALAKIRGEIRDGNRGG